MEQLNNANQPEFSPFGAAEPLARGQSNSFKTSILGFDKEDVLSYIDRLVSDIADQRSNLEISLNRLTDQNRDLIERVNRYEQRIHALQNELDDERL